MTAKGQKECISTFKTGSTEDLLRLQCLDGHENTKTGFMLCIVANERNVQETMLLYLVEMGEILSNV